MARARKTQEEEQPMTLDQRAREVERMNHPNATEDELDALQEKTRAHHDNEMARAEQASADRALVEADPSAALPPLPTLGVSSGGPFIVATEHGSITVDQATTQLIQATTPTLTLTPAEYEARRFEAFKLDLYRCLYKHKYVLSGASIELPGHKSGLWVIDASNASRMKRQLAQAGCIESIVNTFGKVEL